ncbi:hypothetical protein RB601_001989 [Gaeumannomyces tritici]
MLLQTRIPYSKPTMANSIDNVKPCAEGDGQLTANGTGTDKDGIQRGCASADASVDIEAEHRNSNQNRPENASVNSGPNPPASDSGQGEAPPAPEGAAEDAKLDAAATVGGEPGTAVAEKKKKKKKPRNRNSRAPTALNKFRGTGFEENFADPPMTPAEYQEELILYDPDKYPFIERIEESIRRFRGRRRLDSTRTYMFNRYLNLGGIDTSQRQFQGFCGVTPNEDDPLTTQEQRLVASNDVIHRRGDDSRYYDPEDEGGWEVDFTGVVSSFLSRTLPHDVAGDPEYITQGIDLILNWLNYLTHHGVCPEHADDLARARQVCLDAKKELPGIGAALAAGMGQFNYACRAVFNLLADQASPWVDRISLDPAVDAAGISWPLVFCATVAMLNPFGADDEARTDMARWASVDPSLAALAAAVTGVDVREQTVEVVEVRAPDNETRLIFGSLRGVHGCATGADAHRAPAVVVVCPAVIEDGWAGEDGEDDADGAPPPLEEFIFDHDQVASRLRPGMKMRLETAEVHHPRFRLKFVTQLIDIVPSFYYFLPQELMVGFKEPVECDRDPGSVDNPGGKAWSGPFMEVYQGGEGDV